LMKKTLPRSRKSVSEAAKKRETPEVIGGTVIAPFSSIIASAIERPFDDGSEKHICPFR
jgi:hypothetical protein